MVAMDFESSASANSATPALGRLKLRIKSEAQVLLNCSRFAAWPAVDSAKAGANRGVVGCQVGFASPTAMMLEHRVDHAQTARWSENLAKNNCVT
jgi:hypothetical protein